MGVAACGGTGNGSTSPEPSHTPDGRPANVSLQETASMQTTQVEPMPSPTPEGGRVQTSLPPPHYGAGTASVEERVYYSDVVVRASLQSATDEQLRFRATEYLKGTGPTEFVVTASTVGRDTTWDAREAVLFLSRPESQASGPSGTAGDGSAGEFLFTETSDEYYTGDLGAGYTIDSRNPVWLPADEESGASGASDENNPTFITDSEDPAGGAQPTVSLADLRSKIAWVEGGEGVEGYDECVRYAIHTQGRIRDWEAHYEDSWSPVQHEKQTASGARQGTVLSESNLREPGYVEFRLSGQNSDLFSIQTVDDDAIPSNGYRYTVTTSRPMPAGTYSFFRHTRPTQYVPCNFSPDRPSLAYQVTATAPAGTVHEAFFDPVTVGQAVGADGSNGVLKPASFTVGGTATALQGLNWGNGTVTLTLSPYTVLTGVAIDFIALDGSLALSLGASAATADSAAGTLTWSVESAPWQAGDKLMLRVREGGPDPHPRAASLTTT